MSDDQITTFADRYRTSSQRRAYLAKRFVKLPCDGTDEEIDDLFNKLVHNESLEAKAERRKARGDEGESIVHAAGNDVGDHGSGG